MPKYNERRIPYEVQVRLLNSFCKVLIGLKTKEAVYNFLKDILNRKERMVLIRRLLIAEMLQRGDTYDDICKKLHCGRVTVARIQRWLNFGRGGLKKAVEIKVKNAVQ